MPKATTLFDPNVSMRAAFPAELYRQHVHAETVFSAVKRKLSAKAPGRSLATQRILDVQFKPEAF